MILEIKKQLDEANKLIFVKKYANSLSILNEIISSESGGSEILVHLRKIELAIRLGDSKSLLDQYHSSVKMGHLPGDLGQLCISLTEQLGQMVEPKVSVDRFSEILETYGESAAAYYGLASSFEALGNTERAMYSYKQCLRLDTNWYPAYFGLSQVSYRSNLDQDGDYYFYMFETFAPFNLYGNFSTHKRLTDEFSDKGSFEEAEIAITTLSEWWVENKGSCPIELKIYEILSLAEIARKMGGKERESICRENAHQQTLKVLEDPNIGEDALYFIAKSFEEFSDFDTAFVVYRKILKTAGNQSEMVKKIGNQFLKIGEFDLARLLFEEAYQNFSNEPDIRFCLLVAKLKIAGIDVDAYMERKDAVTSLVAENRPVSERLKSLLDLEAVYSQDSDIQRHIGSAYRSMGSNEEALKHYKCMIDLDPLNSQARLTYASFLFDSKEFALAQNVIEELQFDEESQEIDFVSLNWLRARLSAAVDEFQKAIFYGKKALQVDPWDVGHLSQLCMWAIKLKFPENHDLVDELLFKLGIGETNDKDWIKFVNQTRFFVGENCHEIVFIRSKICFLYDGSTEASVRDLVSSAVKFDANQGASDLLRLLNTNFDSFWIYWALGKLSKEMWQLETASMWFEHLLNTKAPKLELKEAVYADLSDCYVWRNTQLQKAVEYSKSLLENERKPEHHNLVTLAHAYLKLGLVRESQESISMLDPNVSSVEATYLQGLLLYRNGMTRKAKELWKPLLSNHSRDIKNHHIKQELLKYYFGSELYLKVN